MPDITITFTVRSDSVQRFSNAMCSKYDYDENKLEDEAVLNFIKRIKKEEFINDVLEVEKEAAMRAIENQDAPEIE
jgi:hypothetical protein